MTPIGTSPTCACAQRKEIETVRVSDELNVDIAPDGSVYGIELLNANEQLRAADGGRLVLVEKDGREQAIGLSPP